VVVTQVAVDVLESAAGSGHDTDVGAPTGGDLVVERAQDGVLGRPLDRLDDGSSDQPGSLLGDPAAADLRGGLVGHIQS
jgi:hypothetical protein